MEIKKEDLEYIIEQLEDYRQRANAIADEAYNCMKVVEKIIKEQEDETIKFSKN